jgi:hypothetical protein
VHVSKVEGAGEGDQFYVTHCATSDSMLNNPGYSVRAASVTDAATLNSALRYPPYELPMALWQRLPAASSAPRRLARTKSARGVWAVHSAFLPRDTVGRDRSYFTHLLRLPTAYPATVLRSWGADEWVVDYPPGAPKTLSGNVRVPAGTLVDDAALTGFLGPNPPGTTELSVAVCPWRLRGPVEVRREHFERFLLAAELLAENETRRLFVHAEPGVVALFLYGAVRLMPPSFGSDLTFSTFEPAHLNLRDFKLARVVGTYTGAPEQGLPPEIVAGPDLVLDTFDLARSSPELRQPPATAPTRELKDLVQLAVTGNRALVSAIQGALDAPRPVRAWITEAAAYARGEKKPPAQQEALSLDEETEALSLDDVNVTLVTPAKQKAPVLPPAKPVGGMTYSAQISRTNPACLLFLIDQSKSMADPFIAGTAQTKAGVVADALNRLIQNVVLRSAKADGVRDYFRVGVIGYGTGIKAGLGGSVPFNVLIPVSQLGAHPLRVETRTRLIPDGVGGTVEQKVKFPVWFEAEAGGQTPMCEAFAAAGLVVKGFIEQYPDAYPPIVLNLSDGMPSDGNPQLNARLLTNQGTSDGAALLFNLLISSKPVAPDYFPATEERLPDVCSKLLFRMSSVLPPRLWEAAKAEGHDLRPRARGAVINADPTAIVRFLDIGTRVTPSGK